MKNQISACSEEKQHDNLFQHSANNEAKTDETVLMEYRVIFLGDSEAGKTLLMSRLKDPQMNPADFKENTTKGINIFSKVECLSGKNVQINYWDFGGQEILNSLHRMFLSENALYVIVLNTRNDNQNAQANFWLRYVQAYAPEAPVMLVMNKIDQNKRADLNLPALSRQFQSLEWDDSNVLRISAIEPNAERFRQEFTEKLHQQIAQRIIGVDPFTPLQAQIRDALRATNKNVISTDDFRDICEEYGLNKENCGPNVQAVQDELLSRFNEAGIMISFRKDRDGETELLYPVLLEPEWITKTIYRILNAEDLISQNGVVRHDDIKKLCRTSGDKWQGSRDADDLLAIMRVFGLSYTRSADDVQEFITMLCQIREPEAIEELTWAEGTIEFQMVFDYLPSGVLYKTIVKYYGELDIDRTWRTGAKIGCKDDDYVILRQDGNTMKVYVHHANKAHALKRLDTFVEAISTCAEKEYRAKSLEKKIGFEVAGIPDYFDYDRLVKANPAKVKYVASKVNGREVAISDILAQEDRSERRDLDELLRLTLIGCKELQDNQTYYWRKKLPDEMEDRLPKMNEDSRTRVLKSAIGHTFFVEDQPKGGNSATGITSGELDLRICFNREDPWSILEALNITSETDSGDKSKTRWLEHLKRLTTDYNQSCFRYVILMSYLLAPAEEFLPIRDAYHNLLRTTELEIYGKPKECEYEHLPTCPERISISRADYSGSSGDVSVFHFLVYIPEYTGKQEETTENTKKREPAKKAAKKKTSKNPAQVT